MQVRQSLYKTLKDKNVLPEADAKDLNKGYSCLVGTTDPVDPEEYPFVKSELATRLLTIGEGTPYTVSGSLRSYKKNSLRAFKKMKSAPCLVVTFFFFFFLFFFLL